MRRILVFMLVTCLFFASDTRSSRSFIRDTSVDTLETLTNDAPKTCGECENTVFEIKCGGECTSKLCPGCELICGCKDVVWPPSPAGGVVVDGDGGDSGIGVMLLGVDDTDDENPSTNGGSYGTNPKIGSPFSHPGMGNDGSGVTSPP